MKAIKNVYQTQDESTAPSGSIRHPAPGRAAETPRKLPIRHKERALVCFPVRAIWQAHLLASLGEVFSVFVLYIEETLKDVGSVQSLTVYTEAFIRETRVATVFVDVERFYRHFDGYKAEFEAFHHVLEKLNVYPFLFDDVVYREKNLEFLKRRKYEMVLTACPISVLKFEEQGIPATFFPLEGHSQWYFRSDQARDIDILFYGTLRKGMRKDYLAQLADAGFSITHAGDEKRSLSVSGLCDYIRRSKIVINFSEAFDHSGLLYQFKGRILEAGFCGSLCLTETNPAGRLLIGPDLPEFGNLAECVAQLHHLLGNPDAYERARAAFAARCESYRPVGVLEKTFLRSAATPVGNAPSAHGASLMSNAARRD